MYRDRDDATIKGMGQMMAEKFAELADKVEDTVPASGAFEAVCSMFKDETESMDIKVWSMTVRDLIYKGCDDEVLSRRYLELMGVLGGGYGITRVVGSGSVAECVEILRSPSFVTKVMGAMKGLLKNSSL